MRTLITGCLLLSGACLLTQSACADVNKGDAAPTFESVDDQGQDWKSSDHVGKQVLVVYFYPADMTGGCTKQACGFRDDMKKLAGEPRMIDV